MGKLILHRLFSPSRANEKVGPLVQDLDSIVKGTTYLLSQKWVGVNSVLHPMSLAIHSISPLKWEVDWASNVELPSPIRTLPNEQKFIDTNSNITQFIAMGECVLELYEGAYPTIKIFMHGVLIDYYGPRKAKLLARYLKKFVAPDFSVLESNSSINEFVEAARPYFPIYFWFGLNEYNMKLHPDTSPTPLKSLKSKL
uniref:Uncharacterized protein n=1 Tax=Cucumis melo TaxID=3656 RepID=A0A9I9ECS4_CUCME